MGFNLIEYELKGYRDATDGTVVFNRTVLPQNRCEEFRSVAQILDGVEFHKIHFNSTKNTSATFTFVRNNLAS